jgi:hypothetical protein
MADWDARPMFGALGTPAEVLPMAQRYFLF